jgi:hypothetical protein
MCPNFAGPGRFVGQLLAVVLQLCDLRPVRRQHERLHGQTAARGPLRGPNLGGAPERGVRPPLRRRERPGGPLPAGYGRPGDGPAGPGEPPHPDDRPAGGHRDALGGTAERLRALPPHPHLGGVQHRGLCGARTPLRRVRRHHRHRASRPPRLALHRGGGGPPARRGRPLGPGLLRHPGTGPGTAGGTEGARPLHRPRRGAGGEDGGGDERPRPRRRTDRYGRRDGLQEPQGRRPAGHRPGPPGGPGGVQGDGAGSQRRRLRGHGRRGAPAGGDGQLRGHGPHVRRPAHPELAAGGVGGGQQPLRRPADRPVPEPADGLLPLPHRLWPGDPRAPLRPGEGGRPRVRDHRRAGERC